MTHGYFYICDQCDERISRALRHTQYRAFAGVKYFAPSAWISVSGADDALDFCSKKCAKNYARKCK